MREDEPARETGRNGGSVIYGERGDDGWSFQTVATLTDQVLGFAGARRTVALEIAGGEPVVAFVDESRLGLARRSDGAWTEETILAAGDDPFQVAGLALDAAGAPHLTFSTVTGSDPLDGEVWYVAPQAKGAG